LQCKTKTFRYANSKLLFTIYGSYGQEFMQIWQGIIFELK
jgi:hypothetical protein